MCNICMYTCVCESLGVVLILLGWGIGGIDETALKWIGGVLASCILVGVFDVGCW